MLVSREFKPGDLPPEGYLEWHEWAEVQAKAGLKQKECGRCGRWKFPQELSSQVLRYTARTNRGEAVGLASAVCITCAEPQAAALAAQAEELPR